MIPGAILGRFIGLEGETVEELWLHQAPPSVRFPVCPKAWPYNPEAAEDQLEIEHIVYDATCWLPPDDGGPLVVYHRRVL